ncbi:hypothetical protein BGZ70_002323, partial [Mortierella alpina]
MSTFYASPTLQSLADAVKTCICQGDSVHLSIPRASRDGPLDLSYAQQRLWFLAKLQEASGSYHANRAFRLHGALDRASLQRAMNSLYARHESLRCAFPTVDGEAQLQILPVSDGLPFVILDIGHEQDQDSVLKQAALQEAAAPFDMERGPLVRARLIRLSEDQHVFLITLHHIITDGFSTGVMFRDLNRLYDAYSSGQADPLDPLSIQYLDYAAWQRQQLTPDTFRDHAAYWRENLTGAPESLELPLDRPRPPQQSLTGASVPVRFNSQLRSALKSLSHKHGVTMFMTMLAAWGAVLSRLSGQDDIVIGTPSANRNHQQVEQLIGFFVSTLALRINLSEEPSAGQLLERVRKATIAAQAHQDIPFEQVVEVVRPPRRTDMTPIFQVMFAWQNQDHVELNLHGIEVVPEDIKHGAAKFDLELVLHEEKGEIIGVLNYSTALFDHGTIERHMPVDRQSYIASDCGSTVLITDESTDIPSEIQAAVVRVSTEREQAEHKQVNVDGSSRCSLDTAYVMYTSGSTGRPKGVLVPHRGVARLVINNGYVDIGNDDRVAFGGNTAFDLSTFEVWISLLNGASIVIINQTTLLNPLQLAVVLDRHQVTLLCLTAALFHQYVQLIGATLSKLRYLKSVGEQGRIEAFTEVAKHGGQVCVLNGYGPTETSAISTVYRVTAATSQLCRLPIGRPISNTSHYVLDKHQCPVLIGVVGELYIGGPGVANGYLNQPELTAERFLPDLFSNVQGARMYKTGDLVRYMSDGNLVFVGRSDTQVKIRGFRVELGEIEARLAEHPLVREAVVLALGESGDDKRLVAYVLAKPQGSLVHTLQKYLSVKLPEYMIPTAFVRMDAFPLTNNGKIDRRALPEPRSDSFVTHAYVAPQGELEIALAAIWSDLLKVER